VGYSRKYSIRFKEHIYAMHNNRPDSGTGHTYKNMENTVEIIRKAKKGKLLNSLKKIPHF
jgi:hypothetical protein